MDMRKGRVLRALDGLLILGGCGLLLAFPRRAAAGALAGVELCRTGVIPALFPFFVLSALFRLRALPARLGRRLEPLFRRLFAVSGPGASVLLLGLVSGYPVGASAAAELYLTGGCGREEAQKLTVLANNCGPAFILGILGGRVFGSPGAALPVLGVHIAVTLWLGLLLGAGSKAPPAGEAGQAEPEPFAAAFPAAAAGAGRNALQVCAYVVFFSVPLSFLPESPLLRGLIELTGGLACLSGFTPANAALAAFLLGWGGLSVCAQVLRFTAEAGLDIRPWLVFRLLHGAASALAVLCLLTRPLLLLPLCAAAALAVLGAKSSGNRGKSVLYWRRGDTRDLS
jgi:nucleoside recognition membrane protein YjiH